MVTKPWNLTVTVVLILLSAATTTAQRYRPLYEVQPLSGGINSMAEESKPIWFGDTLFFGRLFHEQNEGGFGAADIWFAVRNEDGTWTEPSNDLGNLNDEFNNALVGVNASGSIYYLLNSYKFRLTPRLAISQAVVNGQRIGRPRDLKLREFRAEEQTYDAYVDDNLGVIVVSMSHATTYGKEDLYILEKDDKGRYSILTSVGEKPNSDGSEISPFLTPDGKRLYFASNGLGGSGDFDIFFVDRLDTTTWTEWSEPVNLGPEVNTYGYDAYYFQREDGEAIFCSKLPGRDFADIFSLRQTGEEFIPGSEPVLDEVIAAGPATTTNELGEINTTIRTVEISPINLPSNWQIASDTTDTTVDPVSSETSVADNGNTSSAPVEPPSEVVVPDESPVVASNTNSAEQENTMAAANSGSETTPVTNNDGETAVGTIDPIMKVAANNGVEEPTNNTSSGQTTASPSNSLYANPVDQTPSLYAPSNNAPMPTARAVYFASNSSVLTDEGKSTLNKMLNEWKSRPELTLIIEAHTDDEGDEDYNLWLSNRRAKAVLKYMEDSKYTPTSYTVLLKGESDPAVPNSDSFGRRANRRVEVYFFAASNN